MKTLSARGRLIRRRIRITGWTALSSLLVTIVGFLVFFHTVFAADRTATLEVSRDDRVVVESGDGYIVMRPAGERGQTAVLYFPGARVDPHAYLHPFADVAAAGATIVVAKPLMNMALFDPRSIEDFAPAAPGVTRWILAGHSLGGVKACMLAGDSRVAGLVLFASYCASDISRLELNTVVVLGSEDGLIDIEAVDAAASLLPPSARTITIAGANHASFGTYGPQPGDGAATVDATLMRDQTSEILAGVLAPG